MIVMTCHEYPELHFSDQEEVALDIEVIRSCGY